LSAYVLLSCVAAGAHAQDEEDDGGGGRRATTTAVLIPEGGTDLADATIVGIGIRRGLRDVEGVRFQHPSDILGAETVPEDVFAAREDLEAIADMARSGDAREAARRAEIAIEAFEESLNVIKRDDLVDAYMLRAVAECQQRRRRECAEGFDYVVTFRESVQYDTDRYPPQFESFFERLRDQLLSEGTRGSIQVATEPPGAEVFVDGRSYGPSPVTILGLLAGDHYVTVKATGYEKVIRRVRVFDTHEETYALELQPNPRALFLHQQIGDIRAELGQRRAGEHISAMSGYLFTNHVILGVVRPAPGNQLDVTLYLYHQGSKFLLSQQRRTVSADEAGMVMAEELVQELYEGVDLSGTVEAPEQELVVDEPSPVWQQWWFWTAIGVVVVSGVVALSVLPGEGDGPQEGFTRVETQVAR
jgi:hypothetical protein